MPTTPLSSDLQTLLAGPTSWRFDSQLGPVFTPRFFCCTNPNTLGISDGKEPVAVIELSPNPCVVNETVNYAGTLSYDPDGSITAYDWDFESHTPSSGTANAGTLNYGTAGTYTIELIVTDGTSLKSSPARVELVVLEPTAPLYLATSSGVFYSDGDNPVSWTEKDTGLSGDDLIVYDVKIDPFTQVMLETDKVIWRCGRGGIQVSNDGGATWTEKNPSSVANSWNDDPAPQISDLTFRQLLFVGNRLFVMATWQNGSSEWRSTIFYTDDVQQMRINPADTCTWTEL